MNSPSLKDRYQALPVLGRRIGWALVALLVVMLVRCNGNGVVDEDAGIRPVRLYQVGTTETLGARHFIGRVDAISTVDLSFQVGGRISEIPVQQGTLVPAGELIAALDPADYRLAVREAELQLEQARRDVGRNRSLYEKGALPQAQMDQIETQLELRRVALDTARRNLAYTRLSAPFDALITRRLIDAHSNVQPGAQVVRVQNVDELWVHINVPEHMMAAAEDASQIVARAVFSSQPDQQIELTYREHETEPDAVAQTYRVTFAMPRPESINVLPGMTVTVLLMPAELPEGEHQQLPASALDSDGEGGFRVWVYDETRGTVSTRAVEVLGMIDNRAAIVTGLQGNEQIVSAGTLLLRDGMRVKPFDGF